MSIWKWLIWFLALSPIWGTLLWHVCEFRIVPRMIAGDKIKPYADILIEKYGPRAEEVAFIEEDRAWRYCQTVQQGVWNLVRRELWRRYDAGEWAGPERRRLS